MIFGINGNTRMTKLAGALVLTLAASAAHAATTLVGGGATLPAVGYGGDVSNRLISAPTSDSLLGAYKTVTGIAATYCQTGSGAGKNILGGASGTNVQNPCPDPVTGALTGFGAATVGRSDLTQPSFAGSDSPLSQTDFNTYVANRGASRPVQFPAVAGAIAIAFNKSGVDSLDLSKDQVCGIFNGTITTWNQLVPGTPGNITVVYRSDGSGTSFGFSNFLSANCAGTASAHFQVNQSFATAVNLYGLPASSWNGQSGNVNVVSTVQGIDGAIGYAEAANVQDALGLFATIGGLDPAANLGDATTHKVTINSADVVFNQAITGVNATTGAATYAAITGAPTTQCIALVKPETYATQPAGRYPIVAISYLLGNSQGNGTQDAPNVRNLLAAPYNSTIQAQATKIGAGQGLAFLNAPFTAAQIGACVQN